VKSYLKKGFEVAVLAVFDSSFRAQNPA